MANESRKVKDSVVDKVYANAVLDINYKLSCCGKYIEFHPQETMKYKAFIRHTLNMALEICK